MGDIFISYDRADLAYAERLSRLFRTQGWSVWWDGDVRPGTRFHERIAEALRDAKCVVVVWSSASVTSDWVRDEAGEGARRNILVPVLIEDVEIPLGFRQIQAARLTGWDGDSPSSKIQALVDAVASTLNQPGQQGGSGKARRLPLSLAGVIAVLALALIAYVYLTSTRAGQTPRQQGAIEVGEESPVREKGGEAPPNRRPDNRIPTAPKAANPPPAGEAPPRGGPARNVQGISAMGFYSLKHRLPSEGIMVSDLVFNSDGTLLAAAGFNQEDWYHQTEYDGIVTVWQFAAEVVRRQLKKPRHMMYNSVAFSPDGKSLAIGGAPDFGTNGTATIELVDLGSGGVGQALLKMEVANVLTCRFRRDGRIIAMGEVRRGGPNGHGTEIWVKLIDPKSAQIRDAVAADELIYDSAVLDRQARFIVGQARSGTGVFDVETGTFAKLAEATRSESPYAISSGGKYVAFTKQERWVVIVEAQSGQVRSTLKIAESSRAGPRRLTFSTAGALLAVSTGRKLQIWDVATGELQDVLEPPNCPGSISAVAFSPDDRYVALSGGTNFGGPKTDIVVCERRNTP